MAALSLKKHFWKDNVIKKVVKTTFLLQIILQKKKRKQFQQKLQKIIPKKNQSNLTQFDIHKW
jgi:hypothetical protein